MLGKSLVINFKLLKKYGCRKYFRYRKYHKRKLKGNVLDSYLSYSSRYYFPEDIGKIENLKMESGRIGIYKVYYLKYLDDYASAEIKRDFIGYEGIKRIRDCSLEEFMLLYGEFLKV